MEGGRGLGTIGDLFIVATAIEGKSDLLHLFNSFLLSCVCSIRSVMQKYLEEREELTFDKIFNQKIGKSLLTTRESVQVTPKELDWKRVDDSLTFPFYLGGRSFVQNSVQNQFVVVQQ